MGTQVRSWPTSRGCRELLPLSGALGQISRIEQLRNGARPYWYCGLKDAKEEDVDWKEFLMDRPMRPFRADLFTGWYGYRDFSDGPIPGLASHFIDLMNYITGSKFPASAVAQGGMFTWKDEHDFTCPDQVEATWIYPEGFMVSYSIELGNGGGSRLPHLRRARRPDLTPGRPPAMSRDGAIKKRQARPRNRPGGRRCEQPDHFLTGSSAFAAGSTCNGPIDAGYQHAVAVIMAMIACDTGRRQIYDHEKREIREG